MGRVTIWLIASCAAIFVAAVLVSLVTDDSSDESSFDIFRMLFGTSFLLTAVGALITGLVATIRDRERAASVFLALALGLLAVAFSLGDVVAG